VEVFFQNYSHGFAKTVDVHVNARVGRQIALTPKKKTEPEPLEETITNDCSGGQLFGVQGHEAHP
jgi:hypothetical protein